MSRCLRSIFLAGARTPPRKPKLCGAELSLQLLHFNGKGWGAVCEARNLTPTNFRHYVDPKPETLNPTPKTLNPNKHPSQIQES